VDFDKLDARRREWVASDFIEASVAADALQDPAKYSGVAFAADQRPAAKRSNRRKMYTVEDDAKMLHFAKIHGWTGTESLPKNIWLDAAYEHVTTHPWQSMHEHFRKQLQLKTPTEQKTIMARGLALIREKMLQQEELQQEREDAEEISDEEQASVATTPTNTRASAAPATPATTSPPERRHREKRQRNTPPGAARQIDQSREDSETDSNEGRASGDNAVYFRSTMAEVVMDRSKRRRVQALFDGRVAPASRTGESSTESATVSVEDASEVATEELAHEAAGAARQTREHQVPLASEQETDELISQLQLDTKQEMVLVVNALYYCSGDAELARAFLKGASPPGMWSPDDDLLLVSTVAEENADRAAVDAAVARGDFSSMKVPRDTDAILERVKFLR
jgi:hypothetical protein